MTASTSPILAGIVYFALVFAFGVVLGTLRVVILIPAIGPLLATVLELPVILTLSWLAMTWVIRWLRVPRRMSERFWMGATALSLLLVAESLLSVATQGLSLSQHLALYRQTPNQIGLLGQICFATFPLMQLWQRRE